MPNPVDDTPLGPGKIALPLEESGPSDVSHDPQPNADRARLQRFRRRVFYVVAVCCTTVLVTLWQHPPTVRHPIEDLAHVPLRTDIAHDPRLESYQTPEHADSCAEWVTGQEGLASASFELPTAADLLFFLSRGPIFGHISIIETPNSSTGPVEVNLTAQYQHSRKALEQTKVCRMGTGNEHGILVWAEPRHPHCDPTQDVRVNITVSLPTGVRNYKDLTTDLAQFSHSAGDFFSIWSPTSFEVIRLKTSNAAINFGSLVGRSALMQTTNAKLEGFFSGLEVSAQTSNAPIDLIAMMFGQRAGSESRVNLKNSNGAITVHLGLVSDFDDNVLRTTAHTSGAALTIHAPARNMLAAARNASFFLDASTSVGPATAHLYPGYEGSYDLQTTGRAKAQVEGAKDQADPLYRGRKRTVTHAKTGRHAQGDIFWTEDGKSPAGGVGRGSVKMTTFVSPVKMRV
ncbi:hypothetical protein GGX14DRAFT_618220 [Mycena pura]|uniref:Uncharacterized protein n=1 Tax=Mycena pura TaxID=153505 RepID=A0AAD6YFH1_9AGAR|nr:hypothetical protein GGX14DRAFT_618220 [Mycena pura]